MLPPVLPQITSRGNIENPHKLNELGLVSGGKLPITPFRWASQFFGLPVEAGSRKNGPVRVPPSQGSAGSSVRSEGRSRLLRPEAPSAGVRNIQAV
jgi:hypothetical protein